MQTSFIPSSHRLQTDSNILLLRSLVENDPLSVEATELFRTIIYDYYAQNKRVFAWRQTINPYHIVVSEVMLQQTQTDRVAPKYQAFIERFPTFDVLAKSSFTDILASWKGLGYNRRALGLQGIARRVVEEFGGQLPSCIETLETFPTIGPATARSISTFAFNTPTVFIETNIRSVFIYFFKHTSLAVTDKELFPIVEQALDKQNPREWYYALMDYGVMLKKQVGNVSKLSAHYAKQSAFQGSDRQLRGRILQILLDRTSVVFDDLIELLNKNEEEARIERILMKMERDALIVLQGKRIQLVASSQK